VTSSNVGPLGIKGNQSNTFNEMVTSAGKYVHNLLQSASRLFSPPKKSSFKTLAQVTNNNLSSDSASKTFLDVEEVNESTWYNDKPWTIGLIGGLSVLGCCFFSQVIAAGAKKSKLRLNKYYQKKKHDKD